MPDLRLVLRELDLGGLQTIADLWGLELDAPNREAAVEQLAPQLFQPELVNEIVAALPREARAALDALMPSGRMPVAAFARKHGELRAMGPARRDREQPWRNDPSPAEALWYRGLIGRAFFDEGQGPQEFVFIPDDLLPLLPVPAAIPPSTLSLSSPLAPPSSFHSALNRAADDACTLLSYLQIASVKLEGAAIPPKHREALHRFLRLPEALDWLAHLVIHLGLAAGSPLKPDPMQARPFLEASHPAQAKALAEAWRESREWNDLLHVPGLIFEGKAWRNDPFSARRAILNLLAEVPPGEWWPLEAFVAAVKERQPDFQRPAGDYDSWYIRDAATQAYLRGFENWERVDGALVGWMIEKPMFWLGVVDISPPPRPSPVAERQGREHEGLPLSVTTGEGGRRPEGGIAFCLTPHGAAFFAHSPWPEAEPPLPLQLNADGAVRVPAAASRYDRFQIARVSHWAALEEADYLYRLTPSSLERAARQGIKVSHVVGFLLKATGEEMLPPTLLGALRRWERAGGEAAIKDTVVLKVKSVEMLDTLRRTPTVKRYLGESLGPTAVEVRRADVERLRQALAELGILVD